MRFQVQPGDRVLQDEDEPTALLIYDGVPDWVTLPPELGGGRANVKHGVRGVCPCKRGHEVLILVLDAQHQGKELLVAECPSNGYLWHTRGVASAQ